MWIDPRADSERKSCLCGTVSPLHMNPQVVEFQRCGHVFTCPVTWVHVSGVCCPAHAASSGGCAFLHFTVLYACVLSYDFSYARLCATLWAVACQAPLSMGFCRQEYWSRLSCPPPRDLPDPGFEPTPLCILHWQAGSLPLAPAGKPTGLYRVQRDSIFISSPGCRGAGVNAALYSWLC